MTSQPALAQLLGPLDAERSELVARVVEGLDAPSLQWLSGFAAGVAYERARAGAPVVGGPAGARVACRIAGPAGGDRRIADRKRQAHCRAPGRAAEAAGLAVRVQSARDYPLKDLAKERLLVVVMSTHGDGDPPGRRSRLHRISRREARAQARAASVFGAGARRLELSDDSARRPPDRRAAGRARRPPSAVAGRLRSRL